ncbi:MAG: LacI family transcriptional regulator [Lentisphaerae bacterium]|nr:LacI family transcriptional regulator [Lentisphaerota bacterium]MCP4100561.1 LacI family transcriptional regulator [Lentisphaerota bacterium]
MKVCLKDVAEMAGVSMMSVSRAVHNKPGVSRKVRRKILEVAEEIGYVPNRMSMQPVVSRSTMTIGVVLPYLEHTIFPTMLCGIEEILSYNGYRIFLCCTYNNSVKEFHDISALLERNVDGLIWSPATLKESSRSAQVIMKQQCPMVFMDRLLPGIDADSVIVDDYVGAYSAVMHLIEQGCKKIAHITSDVESWVSSERTRGYEQALIDNKMKVFRQLIMKEGTDVDAGACGMEKLLNIGRKVDAVFCLNDPVAIGACKTLQQEKIEVPGEIAVFGFSDILETQIAAVPISTVFQDASGLGRQSALTLLSRIGNPNSGLPPKQQVLSTHLVLRSSTNKNSNHY